MYVFVTRLLQAVLNGFVEEGGCKSDATAASIEKGLNMSFWHELTNEGKSDMLYPDCPYSSSKTNSALVGGHINRWVQDNYGDEVRHISELIGCCAGHTFCPPSLQNCSLLDESNQAAVGFWSTYHGGFQAAAYFAVLFYTQYVNNLPVYAGLSRSEITAAYRVAEGDLPT